MRFPNLLFLLGRDQPLRRSRFLSRFLYDLASGGALMSLGVCFCLFCPGRMHFTSLLCEDQMIVSDRLLRKSPFTMTFRQVRFVMFGVHLPRSQFSLVISSLGRAGFRNFFGGILPAHLPRTLGSHWRCA